MVPSLYNEMKKVADTYGFTLLMSSPHYSQINGLAKWTIHTIKELLQDCPGPYLALLSLEQLRFCSALSAKQSV